MGRNREPQILLSGSSTLFKDSFSALATESFKAREDNLEHLFVFTEECGTEKRSGGMESSELESTVTESTCMTAAQKKIVKGR